MADHPFPQDFVTAVADQYRSDPERLDETLGRIQHALERSGGKYEYSSEHTFGWQDDAAFYLYGDGIWETLSEELSLGEERLEPARDVHRQFMLDSASERGEQQTVEQQFEDGTEALVVANTSEGDPLFGQDV